jgi:hypothetical protein
VRKMAQEGVDMQSTRFVLRTDKAYSILFD